MILLNMTFNPTRLVLSVSIHLERCIPRVEYAMLKVSTRNLVERNRLDYEL